jgi:hypothetical protein
LAKDDLTWGERTNLAARWLACRIVQPALYAMAVALMRAWGGYRIEDLAGSRRRFREIVRDGRPLLICANHLTCIDSAVIIWALGSNAWYLRNFRTLSWNLPAQDFFGSRMLFRAIGLFSKCIFLDRKGSRGHKHQIFGICRHLLSQGEVLTIFPEGRRSRTGRFERKDLAPGVGRLVAEVARCRVLCLYLRADRQLTFSAAPPRGSRFSLDLVTLDFDEEERSRERAGRILEEIGATIAAQEARFFSARQKRPVESACPDS